MTDRRRKLLHEALTAASAAESFVAGQTLASYSADAMRRLAVERLLEVLGEACSRLAREDASFLGRVLLARCSGVAPREDGSLKPRD